MKRLIVTAIMMAAIPACRDSADVAPAANDAADMPWDSSAVAVSECVTCAPLRLAPYRKLAQPPGARLDIVHNAFQTSAGDILLARQGDLSQVLRYSPEGDFKSAIGRRGRNRGEYRFIRWIAGWRDTLHVFDGLASTRTLYALPDTIPIDIAKFDGDMTDALALPGGGYVVNSVIRTPELIGLPLHVYDRRGNRLTSFGSDSQGAYRRDLNVLQERVLARGTTDTTFFAARVTEYRIEEWSVTGRLLRTLTPEVDWFPAHSDGSWYRHGHRMRPRISDIAFEEPGRMWIVIQMPDTRWEQTFEKDDVTGESVFNDDTDRYFDSVIEVRDTQSGGLQARRMVDEWIVNILGPGRWLVRGLDANGRSALAFGGAELGHNRN